MDEKIPKPVRLQRKRTKGFKLISPNGLPVIYVDRGSKWGNPYKASDYMFESADQCRNAARGNWRHDLECGKLPYREEDIIRELRGKNMACWCSLDTYCHGDDLLEIANRGKK